MNIFISLTIQTANILGIFSDPFEFEGDYGPEVNPTRQQVFELVMSREALLKNLSDDEISQLIEQAISDDKEYGPTLGQLVNSKLLEEVKSKQEEVGFSDADFADILYFIDRYKEKKIFRFLRNNPPELLGLDKALRDNAARMGRTFSLPILGSTQPLEETDSFDLKKNLIASVFTREAFALTKPQETIKNSLRVLPSEYLKEFFGESAENRDLEVFSSPLGQVFFYWMYHSLNLELVSFSPEMLGQINQVKDVFARTLGDPIARATTFKDKLIASDTGVLFTQESDAIVSQILTQDGLFLPVTSQNPADGTLIFLRSDMWEPDYEIVPIEDYIGFHKGSINVILATRKDSGQKFLLASCHGNSTKPEDGRLQITRIMEKFHGLTDGDLQLLIGIDANTKTEEDVRHFEDHLNQLGLIGTQTGPTTIKKRMVTAQHAKAGRFAIDQEDYLITLKPENGGQFEFTHVTVGFAEQKADTTQPLPNIHNPSDHYPVGAILSPRRD